MLPSTITARLAVAAQPHMTVHGSALPATDSGAWQVSSAGIVPGIEALKKKMTKFPESLIAHKPRTLADLKPGEQCAFPLYAIRVNPERAAFVILRAELPPPFDPNLDYGEIRLDENGRYHVSIPGDTKRRWKLEDLRLYELSVNKDKELAPIESVNWKPR